jgi:hypothetical protein
MPFRTRIVCLVSCLLAYFNSFAQQQTYFTYGTNDGLPSSEVFDCIQDQKGRMWFATEAGVARFDGVQFQTFSMADGLTDDLVYKFSEDPLGNLWFITDNQKLCYFDIQAETFFAYKRNELIHQYINVPFIRGLGFDGQGELNVLATYDGLFQLTRDSCIEIGVTKSGHLILDDFNKQDYCYLKPLHRYNSDEIFLSGFDWFPKNQFPKVDYTYNVSITQFGFYRIAEKDYLLHYNNFLLHITPDTVMYHEFNSSVLDIQYWKDQICVGTFSDGLFLMSPENLEPIDSLFSGHGVSGVYADDENSLWLTSLDLGVIHIPDSYFSKYNITNEDDLLYDSHIVDNTIYLGTRNGSLWKFDVNTRGKEKLIDGDSTMRIPTNLIAFENRLISVSWNTEYNYETKHFEKAVFNRFGRTLIALNDTLILGGGSTGLEIHNRNDGTSLPLGRNQGNSNYFPNDILKLGEKKFLVGARAGLFVSSISNGFEISEDTLFQYNTRQLIPLGDSIIVLTKTNGVWMYKNGEVKLITNVPLRHYTRATILGQSLFLASPNGLYIYSFKNRKTEFRSLYHGLSTKQLIGVHATTNGKIFVVTPTTIEEYDYHKTLPVQLPKTFLHQVSIDGVISSSKLVQHDQKILEFKFSGICYRCRSDINYEYRLIGLNKRWQTTSQTSAKYNSLPTGKYRFEVRSITPDGERSTIETYAFEVVGPFWKTIWFYALMLALIGGLIVLFIYLRFSAISRKHKLQQQLHHNRQLAMGLQMNPHFIFNSLNSIQSFIIRKDVDTANEYIAKFSRLMRDSLEAAVGEQITLSNEITILERYVELEEMRLDHSLSLTVSVAKGLNLEQQVVPSFILQPIVENAIWHGIAPKQTAGYIDIKFAVKNEMLCVELTDNGVGLSDKKDTEHKSRSTEITVKRLQLLSNLHKKEFKMVVENRLDEMGVIKGCCVYLTLPLLLREKE